jgi:GlpG protein
MRQAGILNDEREAQRFAAWLVAQRIEAHAEQEGSGWAIWVRDEDQIPRARESLQQFQANPQDPKYRDAERTAEQVLREQEQQRKRAQGNIVEMRGRWGTGAAIVRRCPLVLAMIGICILVYLTTRNYLEAGPTADAGANASADASGAEVYYNLLFTDPRAIQTADGSLDVWASIRRFQVWRLVTPIFIHYGMSHLVFNMFWLFSLGGQIENRRGSRYMAVLILVLAIASNLGQALEASLSDPGGFAFGGMSGVGYGIFGYLLVKVKFDNRDGYFLSQLTILLGLIWFVLCLARSFPEMENILSVIPPIANSAHTVGFFTGMALAYAPLFVRRPAS